ncbi:MAG: class I SAM-dependent methyltransferase [Acetobacteraceae bacterium]
MAVREICRLKFDASGFIGWSPRLRQRYGYFTPDEWYEAAMFLLVESGTEWLDVGCGSSPFPFNQALAKLLSSRARTLVGLDPSENIEKNPYLHERVRCPIEEYERKGKFDVISLQMVAEHITDPKSVVAALARLTRSGGFVVVYTVSKWSPASVLAAITPIVVRHAVKRLVWNVAPEDTFPTAYRMNTRGRLGKLFAAEKLIEEGFFYLNDCRTLWRWRFATIRELSAEKAFRSIGLHYPDVCLLGIYRRA